jgi:hypothetical protein
MNHKIRLTPIQIEIFNAYFMCRGVAEFYINSTPHFLAFGGADRKKELAIQKTYSELVERLVWLEVLQRTESDHKYQTSLNTIGFAAHLDRPLAIEYSYLEFIERQLLNDVLVNCFHIADVEGQQRIEKEKEFAYLVNDEYFVVIIFSIDSKISFGIGKDRDYLKAVVHSREEIAIMTKTMEKTKAQINNRSFSNFDRSIIDQINEPTYREKLCKAKSQFRCIENNDPLVSVDVSALIPVFIRNRSDYYVYYTGLENSTMTKLVMKAIETKCR